MAIAEKLQEEFKKLVWRRDPDDARPPTAAEKKSDELYYSDYQKGYEITDLTAEKVLAELPDRPRLLVGRVQGAATWGGRTVADNKFMALYRPKAQELNLPFVDSLVTPSVVEFTGEAMPIRPVAISKEHYLRFMPFNRVGLRKDNNMSSVFASERATPLLEAFDDALATIKEKLSSDPTLAIGALTVAWCRRCGGSATTNSGQHRGKWGLRAVYGDARNLTGGYSADSLIYDGPVWLAQFYYLVPKDSKASEFIWIALPGWVAVDPVEYSFVASTWCQRETTDKTESYDMFSGIYNKLTMLGWLQGQGAAQIASVGIRKPRKILAPRTEEQDKLYQEGLYLLAQVMTRPQLGEPQTPAGVENSTGYFTSVINNRLFIQHRTASGGIIKSVSVTRNLDGSLAINNGGPGGPGGMWPKTNLEVSNAEGKFLLDTLWQEPVE